MIDTDLPLVLRARQLEAFARPGRVFGPIDLDLHAGDLCVVTGPHGSGKSTLMLALSGRFRRTQGELEIAGVDALAQPHHAIRHAAVASLGSYVALEDALTVGESIVERGYLDGIGARAAQERFEQIEEFFGYRIERSARIDELPALVRAVFEVALVALKPASVIVADDVDLGVGAAELPRLYQMLTQLAQVSKAAVIVSCMDATGAPVEAVRIEMDGGRTALESDVITAIPAEPEAGGHSTVARGDGSAISHGQEDTRTMPPVRESIHTLFDEASAENTEGTSLA